MTSSTWDGKTRTPRTLSASSERPMMRPISGMPRRADAQVPGVAPKGARPPGGPPAPPDFAGSYRLQRLRVEDLGDERVLVEEVHLVALERVRAGGGEVRSSGLGGPVVIVRAETVGHAGLELLAKRKRHRLPADDRRAPPPFLLRIDAARARRRPAR